MEIVFVRHAEKEAGKEDPGLTKKGIKQTKRLIRRLRKEKFHELYCSSMRRSRQTAYYVSRTIKLKPKIEKSLDEFNAGVLKEEKRRWDKKSKKQFEELKKFLDSFTKRANSRRRILIISHGNTNRLIMALLLELELKNLIRFRQLETAINEAYWMEHFGNWRLKYWNDISYQPKKLVEGEDKY